MRNAFRPATAREKNVFDVVVPKVNFDRPRERSARPQDAPSDEHVKILMKVRYGHLLTSEGRSNLVRVISESGKSRLRD